MQRVWFKTLEDVRAMQQIRGQTEGHVTNNRAQTEIPTIAATIRNKRLQYESALFPQRDELGVR
jgi:hypothetical protein